MEKNQPSVTLSVIVLTHNSQATLDACLSSVSWADEIVLVDDFSADRTVAIAQSYPRCRIYRRRLNDDFANQRNFAMARAKSSWQFFIDADEIASPRLVREIQAAIRSDSYAGYEIPRQDRFLGQILRFGETGHIRLLRLFRSGYGYWKGRVHETVVPKGPVGRLTGSLEHCRDLTLTDFITRINWYSSIVAAEKIRSGQRFSVKELFFYPVGKFLQNYFWRMGWRDGLPGLIMAYGMSLHSLLVRTKLYAINRT